MSWPKNLGGLPCPREMIVLKSPNTLQRTEEVRNFNDPYFKKGDSRSRDTLKKEQDDLDKARPGEGLGAGLAANQIEYPEPDYPKNFVPPRVYLLNIVPSVLKGRLRSCSYDGVCQCFYHDGW